MTTLSLILLAILIPPVIFDLIFSPTIRRLGIRNVTRRASEAALVVGGSLLATALITASFVIGDSFDSSIRDIARTSLGPTDMIVSVDSQAEANSAAATLTALEHPDIDGVLAVARIEVAVGTQPDSGLLSDYVPDTKMMEVDLSSAASFGADTQSTGLADVPNDLGPGEVVVNTDIAEELDLEVGDTINVFANNEAVPFVIAEIVPVVGLAGMADIIGATGSLSDQLDLDSTSFDQSQSFAAMQSSVLISNTGGVFAGADLSDSVSNVVAESLGQAIEVRDIKLDILTAADEEGAEITELFGTIGGFSVIAGILLVVNLFVMLASERRPELGTMRALGVTRRVIVRAFALEGAIYGALASLLGAIAGIAVGAGVVAYASANFPEEGSVALAVAVKPGSLLAGAAIGFSISQLTVLLTSLRTTKLNIVRALKDIAEPKAADHPTRNTILGALGLIACAGLWSMAGSSQVGAMLIPCLGAVAAIPIASRLVSSQLATIAGCLGGLAWAAMVFRVMGDTMQDPEVAVFLLQGVLMVGLGATAAGVLGGYWTKAISGIGGVGIATRLGMAYPLARRARSVMLVSMFSLVLFTVTLLGIINAVFNAQAPEMARRVGGDYNMLFTSNASAGYTVEELDDFDGVAAVTQVGHSEVDLISISTVGETGTDGVVIPSIETFTEESVDLSFLDTNFNQVEPPAIQITAPEFDNGEDAWDAVINGSRDSERIWVVVSENDEIAAGDVITLSAQGAGQVAGDQVQVHVAGVAEIGWLIDAGLYISDVHETVMVERSDLTNRFYLQSTDGVSPEDVSAAITESAPDRGADARTMESLTAAELKGQNTIMSMLQGYLVLGLVIGVAGLSVVLIRAVRERRGQIGMMRAIGIPRKQIAGMFLVEGFFIGIQGVLLGLGLGTLSAWQTITKSAAFERGLSFNFPAMWMLGLAGIALGLSLLSAVGPALRSTKESPADALRFTA